MASSYARSSTSALKSWESKKPKTTLVDSALGLVQQYALPVAILGFLARRFLAHRKEAAKKAATKAEPAEASASTAPQRKPRHVYKVAREREGSLLVGVDDEDVEVQPHDNVMEAYDEQEVEKAGAAAAGPGGGNQAMLQMLQQMGYKIIMPKDGSGQVFLVPPGAAGPGGPAGAIAEGDEEGFDEDEEGEEEEDE
ncbi:hypothetical protein GPECTOR_23g128 [Gonium pectorale]|uniref:Uncharacterized protein n=1 Tax=Gonium pectorale TaxID=33097 RepID=A0A150GGS4_GONPE|nr:hypothetical protein GPECTOR_23g128 [Gonium pectorale]|eukprot:KXZ49041.1 hypothetical protein GPECTOR_23g128 [Gonium pectorale]